MSKQVARRAAGVAEGEEGGGRGMVEARGGCGRRQGEGGGGGGARVRDRWFGGRGGRGQGAIDQEAGRGCKC